jgi:hypothetical protein
MFDPDLIRLIGFALLFLPVAPLFPFLYVVLRWRSQEPGAGTFAALLYFRTAALLLALGGAANLSYGWFSTTPTNEELTRISWGVLVGSGAFLLLNGVLAWLAGRRPGLAAARRVFTGFLMVMSGLVAFTALLLLFVTVFRKPDGHSEAAECCDEMKLYGAWTAYYVVAYLGSVWWLSRGARGGGAAQQVR